VTPPRILIIEDEADIARGIELNLVAEGYAVTIASTGPAGLDAAVRDLPDLVILDIMLPGMSGLDVCRELRKRRFDSPIIMLTARSAEVDRVVGLEIGADDYVTKPFGIRELLARIRVRLRRHAGEREQYTVLRFGRVEVDFDRHEAKRAGVRVELTGKEFDVLRLLADHRGKIVTRDQLLEEVWGYEYFPTTRTVDNHILRLRQKLEDDPSDPRFILSIYGEGYKFVG
jgi:DNA-binding response OmpR family regulator